MDFPFPKYIAHRGASAHFPENTLLAIKKAKEMGASWIEFDVNVTKDNVPIIFHDETLERIAKQKTILSALNYLELHAIDIGSWFSPYYKEERIPSLQDVLSLASTLHLNLNIELKPSVGREEDTVSAVLTEIKKSQFQENILFSSFSMECLAILRQHCSQCAIGLLFHQWDEQWQEKNRQLKPISIHLNAHIVTPKRIQAIKQQNLKIMVYTVNSVASARSLFYLGVDGIFSDYANLGEKILS